MERFAQENLAAGGSAAFAEQCSPEGIRALVHALATFQSVCETFDTYNDESVLQNAAVCAWNYSLPLVRAGTFAALVDCLGAACRALPAVDPRPQDTALVADLTAAYGAGVLQAYAEDMEHTTSRARAGAHCFAPAYLAQLADKARSGAGAGKARQELESALAHIQQVLARTPGLLCGPLFRISIALLYAKGSIPSQAEISSSSAQSSHHACTWLTELMEMQLHWKQGDPLSTARQVQRALAAESFLPEQFARLTNAFLQLDCAHDALAVADDFLERVAELARQGAADAQRVWIASVRTARAAAVLATLDREHQEHSQQVAICWEALREAALAAKAVCSAKCSESALVVLTVAQNAAVVLGQRAEPSHASALVSLLMELLQHASVSDADLRERKTNARGQSIVKSAFHGVEKATTHIETVYHVPEQRKGLDGTALDLRVALYREALDICLRHELWEKGSTLVQRAFDHIPVAYHEPLWRFRIRFAAQRGTSVRAELVRTSSYPAAAQGRIWLTYAQFAATRDEQRHGFQKASTILASIPTLHVEALLSQAEWAQQHEETRYMLPSILQKAETVVSSAIAGIAGADPSENRSDANRNDANLLEMTTISEQLLVKELLIRLRTVQALCATSATERTQLALSTCGEVFAYLQVVTGACESPSAAGNNDEATQQASVRTVSDGTLSASHADWVSMDLDASRLGHLAAQWSAAAAPAARAGTVPAIAERAHILLAYLDRLYGLLDAADATAGIVLVSKAAEIVVTVFVRDSAHAAAYRVQWAAARGRCGLDTPALRAVAQEALSSLSAIGRDSDPDGADDPAPRHERESSLDKALAEHVGEAEVAQPALRSRARRRAEVALVRPLAAAGALVRAADAMRHLGDLIRAQTLYLRAEREIERSPDDTLRRRVHSGLAEVSFMLRDFDAAVEHAAACRRSGAPPALLADCAEVEAFALIELGKPSTAVRLARVVADTLDASTATSSDASDCSFAAGRSFMLLGSLAVERGETEKALAAAAELFERSNSPIGAARVSSARAILALHGNDPERADKEANSATLLYIEALRSVRSSTSCAAADAAAAAPALPRSTGASSSVSLVLEYARSLLLRARCLGKRAAAGLRSVTSTTHDASELPQAACEDQKGDASVVERYLRALALQDGSGRDVLRDSLALCEQGIDVLRAAQDVLAGASLLRVDALLVEAEIAVVRDDVLRALAESAWEEPRAQRGEDRTLSSAGQRSTNEISNADVNPVQSAQSNSKPTHSQLISETSAEGTSNGPTAVLRAALAEASARGEPLLAARAGLELVRLAFRSESGIERAASIGASLCVQYAHWLDELVASAAPRSHALGKALAITRGLAQRVAHARDLPAWQEASAFCAQESAVVSTSRWLCRSCVDIGSALQSRADTLVPVKDLVLIWIIFDASEEILYVCSIAPDAGARAQERPRSAESSTGSSLGKEVAESVGSDLNETDVHLQGDGDGNRAEGASGPEGPDSTAFRSAACSLSVADLERAYQDTAAWETAWQHTVYECERQPDFVVNDETSHIAERLQEIVGRVVDQAVAEILPPAISSCSVELWVSPELHALPLESSRLLRAAQRISRVLYPKTMLQREDENEGTEFDGANGQRIAVLDPSGEGSQAWTSRDSLRAALQQAAAGRGSPEIKILPSAAEDDALVNPRMEQSEVLSALQSASRAALVFPGAPARILAASHVLTLRLRPSAVLALCSDIQTDSTLAAAAHSAAHEEARTTMCADRAALAALLRAAGASAVAFACRPVLARHAAEFASRALGSDDSAANWARSEVGERPCVEWCSANGLVVFA